LEDALGLATEEQASATSSVLAILRDLKKSQGGAEGPEVVMSTVKLGPYLLKKCPTLAKFQSDAISAPGLDHLAVAVCLIQVN
jgi:hypothetical protein